MLYSHTRASTIGVALVSYGDILKKTNEKTQLKHYKTK